MGSKEWITSRPDRAELRPCCICEVETGDCGEGGFVHAGRPRLDLDIEDLRARRARGETLSALANDLHISVETLRRRLRDSA